MQYAYLLMLACTKFKWDGREFEYGVDRQSIM